MARDLKGGIGIVRCKKKERKGYICVSVTDMGLKSDRKSLSIKYNYKILKEL
jgi:hypothetical protein